MIPSSLLPQDTRIAELASGFSLVLVGFAFLILGVNILHDISAQQNAFWCILTITFGILQVSSIEVYSRMEHLRFILAWVAGSFWVWISTENLTRGIGPSEIATLVMGIMNLYAFIVNLLLVKQSWK